jgi:hypothetical protein
MANMIPISTVTVGSGGASAIEFTGIPQTYTDLQLKFSGRATSGSFVFNDLTLVFNGSDANKTGRLLLGDGTSAASYSYSEIYSWQTTQAATANTFSNTDIYIPNYTSSNNKSVSIDGATENNGTTAYAYLFAGLWSNTAPITSIRLRFSGGGGGVFAQHSTATLYGIRKY